MEVTRGNGKATARPLRTARSRPSCIAEQTLLELIQCDLLKGLVWRGTEGHRILALFSSCRAPRAIATQVKAGESHASRARARVS